MLKCVVFVTTAYGYECVKHAEAQIKHALAKNGVSLQIFREEEKEKYQFEKSDVLYLTDSKEILSLLLMNNCYAIVFYHEKNKDIFFEGALYAVEDIAQLSFSSYDEAYRRLANLPWDILETERLKVRESTVEDVEAFYRIYKEPSITRYMEDLFRDPDEERVYIETYIKQVYGFYGFGMWTVILKETGQVVGRAGLSIREGYELPELGFVIDKEYQRKGYAYEVCQGILDYARKELFFDKIQALVHPENEASLRLLERLGFVYENNVREQKEEYMLLMKNLITGRK